MEGENLIEWTNIAWATMTMFPSNWTRRMAERWMSKDVEDGFWTTEGALSSLVKRDWRYLLCNGTYSSWWNRKT